MSKKLSSVILPSTLEGEDKAPYQQMELEEGERRTKEGAVFDNAMMLVKDKYWKGATFNGSEVTTLVKESLAEESPYHDYEDVHKVSKSCLIF